MAYHARGVGEHCAVNIFQYECITIDETACKVLIFFQKEEGGRHFENLPATGTLLIKNKVACFYNYGMAGRAMGLW